MRGELAITSPTDDDVQRKVTPRKSTASSTTSSSSGIEARSRRRALLIWRTGCRLPSATVLTEVERSTIWSIVSRGNTAAG